MKTYQAERKDMDYRDDGMLPALPADLTAWSKKNELLRHVLEAVQNTPLPGGTCEQFAGYSSRMLLTLLTYCYSTGCYGSQDIEREITRESTVHYICARTMPSWDTLRHFRRIHRSALVASMAYLFASVWRERFYGLESEEQRSGWLNGRHLNGFVQEAERRISRALFLDSVALDD